jgi:K+-sensing histidine kinase KdpD/ActR/RegA family two-component response regulator
VASRSLSIPSSGWRAYLFAASVTLVSLLAGMALHPWFNVRGFLFFVPGIVFVARWGGFGPGLFATVLGAASVARWLMRPAVGTNILNRDDIGSILIFIVVGAIISGLCESLRRALVEARAARRRAEQVLARQTLLADAIRVLAASLQTEGSFRRLTEIVVPSMADACAIHALDEDGTVRLVAVKHRDPALQEIAWAFSMRPANASRGWGRVLHHGVPDLMSEITDDIRRNAVADEENRARLEQLGLTSQMSVPLVARGRTLGALTLALGPGNRRFGAKDLAFASEVAAIAAIAIDNASLYERAIRHERFLAEAVRESETARGHADFLAGVGRIVSASLDYEPTVEAAVEAAVPRLADYSSLLLVGDAGELRQVASSHVDPGKARMLAEIGRRYVARPHWPNSPASLVVKTGRTLLVQPIDLDELRGTIASAGGAADRLFAEVAETLAPHSYLGVPLRGRDGVAGVISFVMSDSNRTFSPADIRLAEEFASRVAAAVENARLFRVAQESNRVKEEFLSTLSHELRTPLNAVLGWSRMLAAGQVAGPAAQRAAEGIFRNAKLQLRLVEDILDVARGLAGKLHLDFTPVDAVSIVEGSIASALASASSRGVTIVKHLPPSPVVVPADEGRLRQIVDNLVLNAIKFTPPGGRIDVQLTHTPGIAKLVVCDNGIGIPADFLPHVFERFRQADASSTRTHGGLGLGLSIVRQLVQLHAGTVVAESEGKDCGATFTVRLPAVLSAEEAPSSQETIERETAPLLTGLPILIVDDDRDHLEVASAVLTAHGAAVTTATSATEAEEELARHQFRLLIVDLSMPVNDGFSLIRRLRSESDVYRETPAVALSADVSEMARRRAHAAGFTVHVAKPFDSTELVELAHALTTDAESTAEPSH